MLFVKLFWEIIASIIELLNMSLKRIIFKTERNIFMNGIKAKVAINVMFIFITTQMINFNWDIEMI